MTLREKIEVMEAFERGEEIEQSERIHDNWCRSPLPAWNWSSFLYRIKPKPKQTITIEKWLLEGKVLTREEKYLHIVETSNIDGYIKTWADYKKVKLLDTYEVEL